MDEQVEDENAFSIPDFWKPSSLANFDEQTDIALEFEPLNLEDEGHGQFGVSKDLYLDLSGLSTFNYGPIEDLGALDASSVLSSADSLEPFETVGVWSFPHDLEGQEVTQSRRWETCYYKIVQEPRTVYTSESGPRAFDAIPAAQGGDTKHDDLDRSSRCVIESAALESSLLQLGLGRESVLYRYEEHEESFVSLIGNGRVPGYSLETVHRLSATFIDYGNKTKRLQHFVNGIRASGKSFLTSIALAASISAVIATVHAQIGDPSASAYSILQIQSLFEGPGLILSFLNDMIVEIDVNDEELLSRLFKHLQDSEHTAEWIRPALFQILASASQPWLDSISKWVGLKEETAMDVGRHGQKFFVDGDDSERLEGGEEAKTLDYGFEHLRMPNFVSEEDSLIIFQTGKSLRLLKRYRPEHPLSRPTQAVSLGAPDLDWQFSWRDVERIRMQAQEYEANLQKAILDFDLRGGNPGSAHLHKEAVRQAGMAAIGLPEEEAKAYIHASIATFEKPLPDLKAKKGDESLYSCGCRNFPEENIGPPLFLLPVLSFNPVIASQARSIDRACLRLLFKEHNIVSHFSLLHSFSLFGDGVFASRLSHALFDPEIDSAKCRKGHSRAGISALNLGSRDTWPPASSELRLALMGILTNSYFESGRGAEGSSVFREELPGSLSFAIRDIPEDELHRCMDPSSIEALDFLRLQYRPPPPLETVITRASLAKYDVVFKLLLRAVRMLFVANQLFRDTKSRFAMKRGADPISESFRIESHHFVSAICRYFFNGVQANSETLHRRLKDIDKALDSPGTNRGDSIHTLRDFHENLLDRLMLALMLRKRQAQVKKMIEDIFSLILVFARHTRTEATPDIGHLGFKTDLKETYEKFRKKVRVFIGVCRDLSEQQDEGGGIATSHDAGGELSEDGGNTIAQLLLEFEMSGFYSR